MAIEPNTTRPESVQDRTASYVRAVDVHDLHAQFRLAQIEVWRISYAPDPRDDVEAGNREWAAYIDATARYFFHPVDRVVDLAMKLEAFVSDDMHENVRAAEYLAVMAADARGIAHEQGRAEALAEAKEWELPIIRR